MQYPPITRRRFISTVALVTAASAGFVRAMSSPKPTHLAFVGIVMQGETDYDRIEAYRINDGLWQRASWVTCAAPRAIALHPTLPILYAANCVAEYQHRPRGTVSAFRIDTATTSLSLLSHEPLSLAATRPDHIAIAPHGMHLAVASAPAGIFNVFALRSDGGIVASPSPLKLSGQPRSLLEIAFDRHSSALCVKFPSHEERLDINSDSSLRRGISTQSCHEHTIKWGSASELNAAMQQKLAAPHAASFALLTH